ncbi:hypothetical protein GKD85_09320, partial [Faecalibacterium prausnitzii]|nr:hypothetical protein [Faecalibacterium prausnitzii]MSC69334.1 hypothetical protein [Faecalibacterium prausnitzii]MSC75308.1 hypothetical protein [Faecalibacterium prausnitzii]MSC81017.1 hypothetical protein [Faecalibacterium prausnitzii]MSD02600.1 hypothetical protein [Faecalibacterium prausnitzii]
MDRRAGFRNKKDEDALLYEVHSDLRDFVLDNLAKKEKQVLDALRIET